MYVSVECYALVRGVRSGEMLFGLCHFKSVVITKSFRCIYRYLDEGHGARVRLLVSGHWL